MSDAKADVAPRRRIAAIWIVPLVAVALGFWMLWFTFQNQGPEITILFIQSSRHIEILGTLPRE